MCMMNALKSRQMNKSNEPYSNQYNKTLSIQLFFFPFDSFSRRLLCFLGHSQVLKRPVQSYNTSTSSFWTLPSVFLWKLIFIL